MTSNIENKERSIVDESPGSNLDTPSYNMFQELCRRWTNFVQEQDGLIECDFSECTFDLEAKLTINTAFKIKGCIVVHNTPWLLTGTKTSTIKQCVIEFDHDVYFDREVRVLKASLWRQPPVYYGIAKGYVSKRKLHELQRTYLIRLIDALQGESVAFISADKNKSIVKLRDMPSETIVEKISKLFVHKA